MVNISKETKAETDSRLRRVIRDATLTNYPETYAFLEMELSEFPQKIHPNALAFIRDDELWSQLVPCQNSAEELFTLFRFEFPKGVDNSGFVGWLASLIKEKFGAGVFVVCGQNSTKAGIYDYWGCPAVLGPLVLEEIRKLQSS